MISGPISSGKTTLANELKERYGFNLISTKEILIQKFKETHRELASRGGLQAFGDKLDKRTKGSWVREEAEKKIRTNDEIYHVIDAIRIKEQADAFRASYGARVIHVYLSAPEEELKKRFRKRKSRRSSFEESATYEEAKKNPTEKRVTKLKECADIYIDSKRCSIDDIVTRLMGHIDIDNSHARLVDVIIGGQYGSEGKGNIASYLAPEYDYLVRVGGPNAGHTVYDEPHNKRYHLIPSGIARNKNAHIILDPGIVIDADTLVKEINDNEIGIDNLSIAPNAIIISEKDKRDESKTNGLKNKIGSTARGVGYATARKITYRDRAEKLKLAKDIPIIQEYTRRSIYELLEKAYSEKRRILIEGTQGSELSIHHGQYPYVTSRDTSVSGCLSEVGVPPTRVRKIIMVCRTYPIRVEDPPNETSGPLKNEIKWSIVSKRSGINHNQLLKNEKTSTTNRKRRVGEFDWSLLKRSVIINGPTDIALTFTDYLNIDNEKARRYEQLTEATINFIEEIERVSKCPVSLICTRFHYRNIIDRRKW